MGNRLCSHASKNLTPVACFPVHKCIEKIVKQRVICGGQKCKIPSAMVSQANFFCSTRQKKNCCHLFWTFPVGKTGGKRKKSKKFKFPPLHSITPHYAPLHLNYAVPGTPQYIIENIKSKLKSHLWVQKKTKNKSAKEERCTNPPPHRSVSTLTSTGATLVP